MDLSTNFTWEDNSTNSDVVWVYRQW